MSIEQLRQQLPDYAKDTKLNISKVLTEDGAEGLTEAQIYSIALACAYATKTPALIEAIYQDSEAILTAEQQNAAKAAATIMGMNNVYYRFVHLVSDDSYATLPANLRMNIMANSGVEKVDFELMSLAVSSINGCGMCIDAHVKTVTSEGVSKTGVQSCIRIAAVVTSLAQALTIEAIHN